MVLEDILKTNLTLYTIHIGFWFLFGKWIDRKTNKKEYDDLNILLSIVVVISLLMIGILLYNIFSTKPIVFEWVSLTLTRLVLLDFFS